MTPKQEQAFVEDLGEHYLKALLVETDPKRVGRAAQIREDIAYEIRNGEHD